MYVCISNYVNFFLLGPTYVYVLAHAFLISEIRMCIGIHGVAMYVAIVNKPSYSYSCEVGMKYVAV